MKYKSLNLFVLIVVNARLTRGLIVLKNENRFRSLFGQCDLTFKRFGDSIKYLDITSNLLKLNKENTVFRVHGNKYNGSLQQAPEKWGFKYTEKCSLYIFYEINNEEFLTKSLNYHKRN